eukprot:CAMPEP_0204237052 /NCGR_PEP_ID=MMETSP0361-20130328/92960_1 /ASSEMBLY_ACC=CAM_ASM_000343 /TAXON_ID=268821 /ORGANISM="Scrippsiella Hangoei, Strain SHTV-5" /LENGTH=65 /DNA_ID=CAMNT_0051209391 /DNA_START=159 /DNA_END=352 /DNA_ORIENTATION=+
MAEDATRRGREAASLEEREPQPRCDSTSAVRETTICTVFATPFCEELARNVGESSSSSAATATAA